MTTLRHDEITRLTPTERLSLIGDLWDSLADEDVPVPAEQRKELARRLATFDEEREHAVTWAELKLELVGRSSRRT